MPLPDGFQLQWFIVTPDDSTYVFGNQSVDAGGWVPAIVKVTPAGSLDGTFGAGGEAVFSAALGSGFWSAALSGSSFYTTNGDFVSKVGMGGGLSSTWGTDGTVDMQVVPPATSWTDWVIAASPRGPLVPGSNPQSLLLARLPP